MKLSIIIPAYNEEKTILQTIKAVQKVAMPKVTKEIIVVDDGSTDATASVVSNLQSPISNFKFLSHKKNQGKGAAVRTGIDKATGDYILIQDADLEYDPKDIPVLVSALPEGKRKTAVYGTRLKRAPNFKRDERTFRFALHYFGNKILSLMTSVMYGQWITDMETGYKLFPRKALDGIKLLSKSFEFEPELTSKLLKNGYTIIEVPISTNPRGYEEGKKLNTVKDGTKAVWALVKYRFSN